MTIVEGKTKRILPAPKEHTVYMETFDVLTGGDAAKKASIEGISVEKTTQTAHVFGLLASKGIPTAFIERHSDNTLLCHDCEMIPLEFVVRRYAWGSYLLRSPEYKQDTPYRFDTPQWEVFHKHSVVAPPAADGISQMSEDAAREQYLRDGVWAKGVYTDPYIRIKENGWALYPQKVAFSEENLLMTIPALIPNEEMEEIAQNIILPTFTALEEAWAKVNTVYGPVVLVDLKVELGWRRSDGKIVLADVIDNDSWRIWPGGDPAKQLDKQCFRDNDPLSKVSENYKMVSELTAQFAE
jgi:phosphoribosylaminoimidazole-succinocarboxamide synthase